jgi:hypothetical protein
MPNGHDWSIASATARARKRGNGLKRGEKREGNVQR